MRTVIGIVMALALCGSVAGARQADPAKKPDEQGMVFRKPFTLTVEVDKDHTYVEKITHVPFVAGTDIYLYAGESFGVKAVVTDGEITSISYEKDPARADIELKFSQDKHNPEKLMMLLVVKNKLKQTLFLDAVMTIPGKKGFHKTSLLPIRSGLSNFESWPHPIAALVLRRPHLKPDPPVTPAPPK